MIIDTHAHLSDDKLLPGIADFLEAAHAVRVEKILSIGTTLKSSLQCVALAEQFPNVIRASVGLHPNNCCTADASDWGAIESLSGHPSVVALGETGLDRHWDDCPWEVQLDYFRRHMRLSRQTDLPLVIHTRDCAEETLDVLREDFLQSGPLRGVMHSFTGPQAVADGCLGLGLHISFAGMVTYKNAEDIRDIARSIPAERILVETDSPYLAPHPHRGQRPNHPAMVVHTLQLLAQIRGVEAKQLAAQTTSNARELFGSW